MTSGGFRASHRFHSKKKSLQNETHARTVGTGSLFLVKKGMESACTAFPPRSIPSLTSLAPTRHACNTKSTRTSGTESATVQDVRAACRKLRNFQSLQEGKWKSPILTSLPLETRLQNKEHERTIGNGRFLFLTRSESTRKAAFQRLHNVRSFKTTSGRFQVSRRFCSKKKKTDALFQQVVVFSSELHASWLPL